jgi:hypothetical protein
MAAYSGSGSGTSGDPYVITTYNELLEFGQTGYACDNYLASYWKLGNDIDATASSTLDGGAGWLPVGDSTNKFSAGFDGDGHTISNLFINRTGFGVGWIGFWGYTNGATISNLHLIDATVSGYAEVGVMVGCFNLGTLTNCYVSGTVSGTTLVGAYGVGGLCGSNGGTITKSYSDVIASETGNRAIGCFCGNNYSIGSITNCYATGSVTGTATSSTGGFCGSNVATITNCYSVGVVSIGTNIGGFCGINTGTITTCYYDTTTSGQSDDTGKGTPKTTANMKLVATFSGWTWTGVWDIVPTVSYPTLEVFDQVHSLTSCTPSSGTSSGGDSVTLLGSDGFTGATGATFGGTAATNFTVVDDAHITCTTPTHAAGAINIVVTLIDTGTVTLTSGFTYISSYVTSCTPTYGDISGGTATVIAGKGFTGATAVKFGTTNAISYVVDSDLQITAVTPEHIKGSVDVVVTIP